MTAIIEFDNVGKKYGNLSALENINLQVQEGEVFSLLGPNGSGKTTLLRIMACIEKPTTGQMRFKGVKVDRSNDDRARAKTTMVFQKTALFHTSVYKNIEYGLRIRGFGKKEADRKVMNALKTVRLEGYERRQAKKLSGGEQQRVALARALALDTDLLLLDEPTANIDPKNISIIEEVLSNINKEKKTTLVIATHNVFQAETLANRAALLLGGKIVKVGTPQEIFTLPTQLLAGYTRVENIFTGVSKVSQEGTSIIDIGQRVRVEAAFRKHGNVSIYVRPEDIILSAQPVISSARNILEGNITQISDLGSIVRLRVTAGKEFTVQITKRSFTEMQLNLDSKVFLAFKASAVQIV